MRRAPREVSYLSKVLVTGCAGFIGFWLSKALLDRGFEVVGIDNAVPYYDPALKIGRLKALGSLRGFRFLGGDVRDRGFLEGVFSSLGPFEAVYHLAAMAGVRFSRLRPDEYLSVNVLGTLNVLECARSFGGPKLVVASTSSVYAGSPLPFREEGALDRPLSPYAASKRSAEMFCFTYHHLYGLDVSVPRYFTVYGPWGRPDMSYFRMVHCALSGRPFRLFGDGSQSRDFTYVEDVVEGTILCSGLSGFNVVNLGSDRPVPLSEMISLVEGLTGRELRVEREGGDRSDVPATWASLDRARELLGWSPRTTLEEGMSRLVGWFSENWDWLSQVDPWREGF